VHVPIAARPIAAWTNSWRSRPRWAADGNWQPHKRRYDLIVTMPTGAGLAEGLDAFGFGGLVALGFRTSLFDFF
jgi:hypothetical protein